MHSDWLFDLFHHNWLLLTLIFVIIELTTFTLLFVWFAIAAVIMAGITYLFPELTLIAQLWTFALLLLSSVIIWYRVFRKPPENMGDKYLNNRSARYIGQTVTLSEAVINGRGKVQLDDGFWTVECSEDLPVGSRVTVVDEKGVILLVKPKLD